RMPVHVDHSRSDWSATPQGQLQEVFCRNRISLRREHKVDGFAGGIHGAVQIRPFASDANIGFIDTPGPIGMPDLPANPLVQFWSIPQHPAADGGMINAQPPLGHQLFEVPQREAISQVPPDTKNDQVVLEMTPSEQGRPNVPHRGLRYQNRRLAVATDPCSNPARWKTVDPWV